ncbi:GAF domain-containing protein [uncultured Nevskia sp.]|uniref:GAF domain-containing protein n=1 Tax=uncultured Nevskia sp. TaxID=228950 RepID=UPI0025DE809B|nr:GAF domain-containing protein [uncultured Nevskia sp.]
MNEALASPPFGEATLSNCERELIHLAGSIQPHGVLLTLAEPALTIVQASSNIVCLSGRPLMALLGQSAAQLGGNLLAKVRAALVADLSEPAPLRCSIDGANGRVAMEGTLHRAPHGGLVVELELAQQDADTAYNRRYESAKPVTQAAIAQAVKKFSSAPTIAFLSEAVVHCVRETTGYDRVMVYKFDPDGHGEIIAEARDGSLDSLLGHHYPATDIPQRARELYIRNRVRVLVDVHYEPVAIVPRQLQDGSELDMSLCHLRSMSPLHLQYLKNMGVTGTLVVSLVREGKLWGLIACHHYSPRYVPYTSRAALELLAEVISTRIAAIENYVQSQVEVLVKRLELRLIEATSTDGDWRNALFRNSRTLLTPVDATGAALFHDGEIMTAGDVPSTPDLRALLAWVSAQPGEGGVYTCASVVRRNPEFASMASTASGVMAVPLSPSRPDWLMWFRKEQPCEYTWAGDPAKPLLNSDDPLTLSPRRSFAAWSEIVRGTAAPWTRAEEVLAKAIGQSLSDIILQIQAVRLLIAQHQLNLVRSQVGNSKDPVIIAASAGHILYSNETFQRLPGSPAATLTTLDDLGGLFLEPGEVRAMLKRLQQERLPWRGEAGLVTSGTAPLPIGIRADVVPGQGSSILGFIVILSDLTVHRQTESARQHFETTILQAERDLAALEGGSQLREPDEVIGAILANANVAAMEIADAIGDGGAVPLLRELETSTQRAAALYRRLRRYASGSGER